MSHALVFTGFVLFVVVRMLRQKHPLPGWLDTLLSITAIVLEIGGLLLLIKTGGIS